MRKGSQLVVCSVVASEMLEVQVLLFEGRSSVGAEPEETIGQLGSWRIGAAAKAEPSCSDLHVDFGLGCQKQEQKQKHCLLSNWKRMSRPQLEKTIERPDKIA